MSILHDAIKIYKKQGLINLARRGMKYFLLYKFPRLVTWNIISRKKSKELIAKSDLLLCLRFYLNETFQTEQRAILHGQSKYHSEDNSVEHTVFRMIRNIHRIEKGLSMKDTRSVFATDYISQTVKDVTAVWSSNNRPERQAEWAVDVLDMYFDHVDQEESIVEAYERYSNFVSSIDYTPGDKRPRPRKEVGQLTATYDDIKNIAKVRHSTRWFQNKKVPRSKIDRALEVAIESPSACNRQSYEFRVYDDPDLIGEITDLSIGVSGYRENIPCLAVIVGKRRAYYADRDRHVIYIDASLAAMAFQFALESQGIASCCINWPVIPDNERELANRISLNNDEEVIMLMAIGYPDPEEKVPYSAKKPVEHFRSYNKS